MENNYIEIHLSKNLMTLLGRAVTVLEKIEKKMPEQIPPGIVTDVVPACGRCRGARLVPFIPDRYEGVSEVKMMVCPYCKGIPS